jgi:hypothetical protein
VPCAPRVLSTAGRSLLDDFLDDDESCAPSGRSPPRATPPIAPTSSGSGRSSTPIRRSSSSTITSPVAASTLRVGPADVHRPELGPARGQSNAGRPAPSLRARALAQVQAHADGADAVLPAVRHASDLQSPALITAAVRRLRLMTAR